MSIPTVTYTVHRYAGEDEDREVTAQQGTKAFVLIAEATNDFRQPLPFQIEELGVTVTAYPKTSED